jgi:DNA-binding transcriptional LysR family regulator
MQWADRIGRRLKPRDLHVFMSVAEHRNMAKAADNLAISRPVVSRTIAELEHTLGVPLFDRSPQGVEPTLYGQALLKRSVAIFDEMRQSVQEIEFLADPTAGELCVASTEPTAAGLLSAVMDQLSRRYPKLIFKMELGNTSARLRLLRERKCEVVIARQPTPEPDLNVEPLYYDHLFVVAGPGNKWLTRRKISLAELVDEPWIHAPIEVEPGGPTFEAFRAIGLEVPRAILSESIGFRYSMLATGRFLTMAPGALLRYAPKSTLLKPLPVEMPRWQLPTSIISLKNRTLSPVAELFIASVRELATPLATGR